MKGKKKKLLIVLPVLLLLVAGAGYKLVLAPKPTPAEKKIEGAVVPLEKEFVVNLAEKHYAKVSVALLLDPPPAAGKEGEAAALEEEAVVRAIVTDELTGLEPDDLVVRARRQELRKRLLEALRKLTDLEVKDVYLTDVTVQ